jgi:hypothetical protein
MLVESKFMIWHSYMYRITHIFMYVWRYGNTVRQFHKHVCVHVHVHVRVTQMYSYVEHYIRTKCLPRALFCLCA